MQKPVLHHIPVCPFCQRIEILLAERRLPDAVEFRKVDITKPRDPRLLELTGGTTALPVLELPDGRALRESLVILGYLDEVLPGKPLRRADPYEHAIEQLYITRETAFTTAGYLMVMNQDPDARPKFRAKLLDEFRILNSFLTRDNPEGTYLFDSFGLAEAVFTPMFMRFWFLDYYEGFQLPDIEEFARVAKWQRDCLSHPSAQQTTHEEIVKLYYDYALGFGNGALPDGRTVSSFTFQPDWRERPMPPRNKYGTPATDSALGLV